MVPSPTQPVHEAPRDDDEDDVVLPRPGGDGVADQPEGESAREVAEAHAGEQPAGGTRGDAFTDGLLLHTVSRRCPKFWVKLIIFGLTEVKLNMV